jgi:hypothetical protein
VYTNKDEHCMICDLGWVVWLLVMLQMPNRISWNSVLHDCVDFPKKYDLVGSEEDGVTESSMKMFVL